MKLLHSLNVVGTLHNAFLLILTLLLLSTSNSVCILELISRHSSYGHPCGGLYYHNHTPSGYDPPEA